MDTATENGEVAFASSGSKLVDLFYSCVRTMDKHTTPIKNKTHSGSDDGSENGSENESESGSKKNKKPRVTYTLNFDVEAKILRLFAESYKVNPINTLKILFYTRDPRGGKGEKDITFSILSYLHLQCPKTYHSNVIKLIKDYGCAKDFKKIINIIGIEGSQPEIQHYAETLQNDYKIVQKYNAKILSNDAKISKNDANIVDIAEKIPKREAISLYAKYAPKQHKKTVFYLHLRDYMFPSQQSPVNKSHYQGDKLYRQMISKINRYLDVVECKMSSKSWSDIKYSAVPSQAMRIYGKGSTHRGLQKSGAFERHDKDRFSEWKTDVASGKSKINATGIDPHQLVEPYMNSQSGTTINDVAELQWTEMIKKLKSADGSESATNVTNVMKNSYAVVDVSGSMSGQPMTVAVALGLIVYEISGHDPITFSSNPSFHSLTGATTLYDKVHRLVRADWGQSTNFDATLKLILDTEIANKTKNETGITLFVFSDMQFDQASGENNKKISKETIHEKYQRLFRANGLVPPKIVYWNLRNTTSGKGNEICCPVTVDSNGTALVSGFSAELLKCFMTCSDFNPLNIVLNAIEKYEVVVDPTEHF